MTPDSGARVDLIEKVLRDCRISHPDADDRHRAEAIDRILSAKEASPSEFRWLDPGKPETRGRPKPPSELVGSPDSEEAP